MPWQNEDDIAKAFSLSALSGSGQMSEPDLDRQPSVAFKSRLLQTAMRLRCSPENVRV
jgi:hypothetical protein